MNSLLFILSIFILKTCCAPVVDENAKLSPEYICRQSLAIYDCIPGAKFWRYDASKGICTEHAGCGSNDNKFISSDDCLALCMNIYDGLYNENKKTDSEETIKIKAFERVDEEIDKVEI